MIHSVRIALLSIKLVMRTKAALFFTFLFPLIFLLVYAGIFARGNPVHVLYFLRPVVTLQIMGSSFWGLGLQSVMQRERGSLRRYRLAPIGPATMVLSSLLANYLLQLPTVALLVGCATLVFHMPFQVGVLTLFVLVTIGSFSFAGFGLTIASLANSMQEAQIYNNVVWFTLLFLSGVTVPVAMLPSWIQPVAAFLPATYLVGAFQSVMVAARPLSSQRVPLLILSSSGAVALVFAWKLFRWEKEERISTRAKLTALALAIPFLAIGGWMISRGNLKDSWKSSFALLDDGGKQDPAETTQANFTLDDFDQTQDETGLNNSWKVSTELGGGKTSVGALEVISPGAEDSPHALRFSGRLDASRVSERVGVTVRRPFVIPGDATKLRGIELQVRGLSRAYEVRIVPPDPALTAPALSFIPDSEWQSIRLPAAWLARPNPFPAGSTLYLEIRANGPPGPFELEIDDITFY